MVNGHWYMRACGDGSLQKVVDEWLESVLTLWFCTSFEKDGVRRGNCTSESEYAEATLREWGLIDEKGMVIESDNEEKRDSADDLGSMRSVDRSCE